MSTIIYDPKGFGDIFASPLGQAIWQFLNTEEIWVLLKLATELGHPAVEAIGDKLIDKFGDAVKDPPRIKQAIGHMVRPIMEFHGYDLVQKGVRCRKKTELFVFAAKYAKKAQPE